MIEFEGSGRDSVAIPDPFEDVAGCSKVLASVLVDAGVDVSVFDHRRSALDGVSVSVSVLALVSTATPVGFSADSVGGADGSCVATSADSGFTFASLGDVSFVGNFGSSRSGRCCFGSEAALDSIDAFGVGSGGDSVLPLGGSVGSFRFEVRGSAVGLSRAGVLRGSVGLGDFLTGDLDCARVVAAGVGRVPLGDFVFVVVPVDDFLVGRFAADFLPLRIAVTLAARFSSAAGTVGLAMPLGRGSRHECRHLGHFTFCPAKRSGAFRRLLHSGQATLILTNQTFAGGHKRVNGPADVMRNAGKELRPHIQSNQPTRAWVETPQKVSRSRPLRGCCGRFAT